MSFLEKILFICKSLFSNKSIYRTLTNLKLKEKKIFLQGKILDLGAGSPKGGSYMNFLKVSSEAEILTIHINEEIKPDYKIDFEKNQLPFKENSVDSILIFNLLEHIYNYKFLIKESFRVLRPDGLIIGSTPFLFRVHPSPKRFF